MTLKFAEPQQIKIPGVWGPIKVAYSPHICPSYLERENYLKSRGSSPRRIKIEHNILRQNPPDRLCWTFNAAPSRSKLPLSTLRNYYTRRWKNAFREALKKNGYDSNGRQLSGLNRFGNEVALTGTLEIALFNAHGWEENDHEAMVYQSKKIVKGLVSHLRSQKSNSD